MKNIILLPLLLLISCSDGAESVPDFFTEEATSCTDLLASQVQSGVTFTLCDETTSVGTLVGETTADCTTGGETDCKTTASFTSVDVSEIPGKVATGTTLAGVSGTLVLDFPDASNVLATDTTDNVTGTYTPDFPDAANVRTTDTTDGTTGTLSTCSTGGDSTCVVAGDFKAVDSTTFTEYDIRVGSSLGGVTGALKFNCRNTGDLTLFNFDESGTLTNSGHVDGDNLDWFDTVDDFISIGAASPGDIVTGWDDQYCTAATDWLDVSIDGGTGGDGNCDESVDDCAYKDRMTNLVWSEVQSTSGNWKTSISTCDTLTFLGSSDWRLPTQKEAMTAYANGIKGIQGTDFGSLDQFFWTSTSYSVNTTGAWYIRLTTGEVSFAGKTNSISIICVQGL
jgi:hypothetical protein